MTQGIQIPNKSRRGILSTICIPAHTSIRDKIFSCVSKLGVVNYVSGRHVSAVVGSSTKELVALNAVWCMHNCRRYRVVSRDRYVTSEWPEKNGIMCAGQQTVHKLCQDTRLLIMSTKCRLILKLFFHRQDLVPKKHRTKACRYNWHSAGSLGPGIPKTDCHWTCCALHVQKVTERPTHIGMIGYMHMKRTYDNVYSSFYCLQASSRLSCI